MRHGPASAERDALAPLQSVAFAVVLIGCASLSWQRVFGAAVLSTLALAVLAGAAVAATAMAIRARWDHPRRGIAAGGAAIAVGWLAVVLLTGAAPLDVPMQAAVSGWQNVLTVPLPVPMLADFTALPVTLIICGVAASAAALRKGRIALAVAASLAVWLPGVLLGVGGSGSLLLVAAPLGLASLALFAATAPRRDGASALTPALTGAAILLAIAVPLGMLTTGSVATALHPDPVDPRLAASAPKSLAPQADPLDLLPALQSNPSADPLFTVQVEGDPGSLQPYWRIASFDRFVRGTWTASGSATVATAVEPGELDAQTATQTLTVSPLSGQSGAWIPAMGRVTGIATAGVEINRETDTLLRSSGDGPVRLIAEVPAAAGLRDAMAISSGAGSPSPALAARPEPCLPQEWADEVAAATGPTRSYAGRVEAIVTTIKNLAGPGKLQWQTDQATMMPGHTCTRLQAGADGAVPGVGSEQLSTAAVLALRSYGIPARLGFGYRVGNPNAQGVYEARAKDAQAYPEVWFSQLGWVPLSVSQRDATSAPSAAAQAAEKALQDAGTPPEDPARAPVPPAPRAAESSGFTMAMIIAGLMAAAAAGWLATRSLRRRAALQRARTGGDQRARVLAAWADVLARSRDLPLADSMPAAEPDAGHGAVATIAPPARGTAREVAAALTAVLPDAEISLTTLARLVEAAIYSPQPLSGEAGASAWQCRDIIVAQLAGTKPRVLRTRRR